MAKLAGLNFKNHPSIYYPYRLFYAGLCRGLVAISSNQANLKNKYFNMLSSFAISLKYWWNKIYLHSTDSLLNFSLPDFPLPYSPPFSFFPHLPSFLVTVNQKWIIKRGQKSQQPLRLCQQVHALLMQRNCSWRSYKLVIVTLYLFQKVTELVT